MTAADRFTITISLISLIFTVMCILLGVLIRLVVRFTRTEDKLNEVVADVEKLVADKDKVHAAMLSQMADDRAANNQRLRWLEERYWGKGE